MIDTFYLPGRVCPTKAIREIAEKSSAEFTMICLKPDIEWVYLGLERMVQVLQMTGATMVYSDHFNKLKADSLKLKEDMSRSLKIILILLTYAALSVLTVYLLKIMIPAGVLMELAKMLLLLIDYKDIYYL